MNITAAVVRRPSGPFAIEEVEIEEPRPDEVLVRIVATGICRADLKSRDFGNRSTFLPIVLGHEGSGVVERVGRRVTKVQPGDHVVLSYLACGHCPNCLDGQPYHCRQHLDLNFNGKRPDGSSPLSKNGHLIRGSFFGQSSFATYSLASERNVVKVTPEAPLELLGPLGCSLQTGAGAVMNVLRPRPGSSLAIFGCGAVGLSALMAARIVGCATIIAVDVNPLRLEIAMSLGATQTINPAEADAVDIIRQTTRVGANFALETSGKLSVLDQAVKALSPAGVAGFVTLPVGEPGDFDWRSVPLGSRICDIVQGQSVPGVMIPKLITFYQQGRFPFDRLVKYYRFEEIDQAAQDLDRGITVKPVLRMAD